MDELLVEAMFDKCGRFRILKISKQVFQNTTVSLIGILRFQESHLGTEVATLRT